MSWLTKIIKNGLMFKVSTGKPFNPADQERTNGLKDIMDHDKKEDDDGVQGKVR